MPAARGELGKGSGSCPMKAGHHLLSHDRSPAWAQAQAESLSIAIVTRIHGNRMSLNRL
jgi:hypothetical protein